MLLQAPSKAINATEIRVQNKSVQEFFCLSWLADLKQDQLMTHHVLTGDIVSVNGQLHALQPLWGSSSRRQSQPPEQGWSDISILAGHLSSRSFVPGMLKHQRVSYDVDWHCTHQYVHMIHMICYELWPICEIVDCTIWCDLILHVSRFFCCRTSAL